MNGNLAQFGDDLRLHLLGLQVSLNNINALFAGGAIADEAELASRLDELEAAEKSASERAVSLRERLQDGVKREAAFPAAILSRLLSRRRTAQLHARADLIEELARVAVELATLSALEAERITMAAIRARRQAIEVQVQRNDRS